MSAISHMKRTFDFCLAAVLLAIFIVPIVLVAIAVRCTSPGPIFHWSDRIGRDNRIFRMPKFRTMRTNTPQLATHLLSDAESFLTPIGGFLRRTSLDELPQLFSVFRGDMSLVGPRPALFNQDDLVGLRTEFGVHRLSPGMTGWAQVNGRDDLSVPEKVRFDCEYLRAYSLRFDFEILGKTLVKVVRRDGVRH